MASDSAIGQPAAIVRRLENDGIPAPQISDCEAVRIAYATDASRRSYVPDLVVWPKTTKQVAQVLAAANDTKTPVYVRGRGSATTGSSLAEHGGILLSTELMDRILEIDPATRTATVEPGVINAVLHEALAAHGLFWPPDPSSRAYCTVGGNLATAAAGPAGVKYGGARENVLAIEAVCGSGVTITSGGRIPKSSVGYDLTRLLVGSEGTLAVITAATLKLWPLPKTRRAAVAAYPSSALALDAVARLMGGSLVPAAVEFIDEGCCALVREALGALPPATAALLLLEVTADDTAQADAQLAQLHEALAANGQLLEYAVTDTRHPLWQVRKIMSQKLKEVAGQKINEDVVVPVGQLAALVKMMQDSCQGTKISNLNFGHAAQGNLHVNLLFEKEQAEAAGKIVAKLMRWVVAQHGSISGEHGVGISKREFMPLQIDAPTASLLQAIKLAFDPKRILNPGKPW